MHDDARIHPGGRSNAALVAASAALFVAAFPPVGIATLAPVALAPLLVVAARVSPASAAAYGAGFGLLAALGLCGWLLGTIGRFFALSPGGAWLAFAALALALMALPFAVFACGVRLLARRPPVSPLAVGGLYGGLELARLLLPVPNPWALLAFTQPPGAALLQIADVAGACGVGMLLAAANAVVAGFVSPAFAPRRRGRALAASALVLAAVLGYGALRLAPAAEPGETLRVALVPGDAAEGPRPGHVDADAMAAHVLARAEAVASEPSDLVVWPELALAHSLRDGSPASRRLLALAATSGADWLVGAPESEARATPVPPTNSVFLVRRGHIAGRYDKTELLPFAEVRVGPGASRTRWSAGEGARSEPLPGSHASLGVLLCSEALLPGRARTLAAAGATLLVNPSYDAWLPPDALEHVLRIAALRAIENRRPLLRVATGGPTALVDDRGRITLARGSELLVAPARPGLGATPYQRIGDSVPLAGAAFAAVALLRAVASRRAPRLAFQKETDRWTLAPTSLARSASSSGFRRSSSRRRPAPASPATTS